jgi:hypothetical protein
MRLWIGDLMPSIVQKGELIGITEREFIGLMDFFE